MISVKFLLCLLTTSHLLLNLVQQVSALKCHSCEYVNAKRLKANKNLCPLIECDKKDTHCVGENFIMPDGIDAGDYEVSASCESSVTVLKGKKEYCERYTSYTDVNSMCSCKTDGCNSIEKDCKCLAKIIPEIQSRYEPYRKEAIKLYYATQSPLEQRTREL